VNLRQLAVIVVVRLTLLVGALVFMAIGFSSGRPRAWWALAVAAVFFVGWVILHIWTFVVVRRMRRNSKSIDDAHPHDLNPREGAVILVAPLTLLVFAIVFLAVGFSLGGPLVWSAIALAVLLSVVSVVAYVRTLAVLRRNSKPIGDAPPHELHPH
jgi:Kef-type K+ transport system membrane component KefB